MRSILVTLFTLIAINVYASGITIRFTEAVKISIIDGNYFSKDFILVDINGERYGITKNQDGSLTPQGQRAYEGLLKVIDGRAKLTLIDYFEQEDYRTKEKIKVILGFGISH